MGPGARRSDWAARAVAFMRGPSFLIRSNEIGRRTRTRERRTRAAAAVEARRRRHLLSAEALDRTRRDPPA